MSITSGSIITDFSLINQDGTLIDVSDFKSEYLVIFFYPKDDTPGCTKESCKFRDLYNEFKSFGCNILGISADNLGSHKQFSSKFKLNFDLLVDENYKISKYFGTFFVSDEFGNSTKRNTFLINKNKEVIRVWDSISEPENHPDDVLKFVQNII